jgi:hypothetical protein
MINPYNQKTFWRFDENLIALEEGTPWSKGDSIGRNAFFYIFHPNVFWLKKTLLSCVKQRDDGYVQFYRYPNEGAETMSRDHVSAIILALYLNRDYTELKWILDNLPLQLSRRYWQTLDFWLWQKTLKAEIDENFIKRFVLRESFFLLNFLLFLFTVPWNFILRFLLQVKRITPQTKLTPQPKWKKWIYQKLIYPHYALYNLSWMIWSLKGQNSLLSWLLRLEAKNPVLKAQLGKPLTKKDYERYQPLGSFQWAGTLDNMIEWVPRVLTEEESKENDICKSNLDYFYYRYSEIMQRFDNQIIEKIKQNQPII